MAKRSIKELKNELQKVKSILSWDEIKEKEVYHIPPLISLERRDLYIISKNGNKATYKKVGDTTQQERTMYDSSVFARFMVKRKNF